MTDPQTSVLCARYTAARTISTWLPSDLPGSSRPALRDDQHLRCFTKHGLEGSSFVVSYRTDCPACRGRIAQELRPMQYESFKSPNIRTTMRSEWSISMANLGSC